jgi:hypothetical protein
MRISGVTWSSTCALISVPLTLPPARSLAPLATHVEHQRGDALASGAVDQRAEHGRTLARVADRHGFAFAAKRATNASAKAPRLAAQFQKHGLQVIGAKLGDDLADLGGSRDIDASHGRVRNQGFDQAPSRGALLEDIDDAWGEAGITQDAANGAVRAWTHLRGLEDHAVAAGKRHGDGTHAQKSPAHSRAPTPGTACARRPNRATQSKGCQQLRGQPRAWSLPNGRAPPHRPNSGGS